jgi:hypothetical protein
MRPFTGFVTAAAVAAAVAGCASDPYYARNHYYSSPSYAYSPGYVYSSPGYYRTTTYNNSYPSNRRTYDGYWDYMRNYRGAYASSPEFSSM